MVVRVDKMVVVGVVIRMTIAMAVTVRQRMAEPMAEAMGESRDAVAVQVYGRMKVHRRQEVVGCEALAIDGAS